MNGWLMFLGALAVAGSLGLEVWKQAEANAVRTRHEKMQKETEIILENLEARLQNPEDCTALLAGQNIQPGERSPVELQYELSPEDQMKLYDARLEVSADDDFRTEIVDANGVAVELRRYPVRLWSAFGNAEGRGVELRRPRQFLLWTTPPPPVGSGQIQSCFGSNSAGALCNDLGGYFIPGTEPYQESCRLSAKTLKRAANGFTPVSNCRVAAMADSPKECVRYGLQFRALQLNEFAKALPVPGNKYLCQICQ